MHAHITRLIVNIQLTNCSCLRVRNNTTGFRGHFGKQTEIYTWPKDPTWVYDIGARSGALSVRKPVLPLAYRYNFQCDIWSLPEQRSRCLH